MITPLTPAVQFAGKKPVRLSLAASLLALTLGAAAMPAAVQAAPRDTVSFSQTQTDKNEIKRQQKIAELERKLEELNEKAQHLNLDYDIDNTKLEVSALGKHLPGAVKKHRAHMAPETIIAVEKMAVDFKALRDPRTKGMTLDQKEAAGKAYDNTASDIFSRFDELPELDTATVWAVFYDRAGKGIERGLERNGKRHEERMKRVDAEGDKILAEIERLENQK